jgi:uncharacterized membrane protein
MQLVLVFQYPVVAHAAFVLGDERLKLVALILLIGGICYRGIRTVRPGPIAVATVLIGTLVAFHFLASVSQLLRLLPVLVPSFLLVVFGATLLPGREPLVTAIGESARGPLSATMRRYTANVTRMWVIVFAALIAEALIGWWLADPVIWSWLMHIVNPMVITVLFVGEFVLRKHWFPDHPHPTFFDYLAIVRDARPARTRPVDG